MKRRKVTPIVHKSTRKPLGVFEIPEEQEFSFQKDSAYKRWLQDFHADCIPIEGRDDLVVLIVSREGTVTHTEVLAATQDMEATPLSPESRPWPYGQFRTSIEDIKHTGKEALQASVAMLAKSQVPPPNQQSKQSQDMDHIEELEMAE